MRAPSLEIPNGKRTRLYRLLEILPGFLSYFLVVLLFILSILVPVAGAVYLLVIVITTLVKAVGVAYRTVQGYNVVKEAQKVDWWRRCEDLAEPHEAYERLRKASRLEEERAEKKGLPRRPEYHFEEHLANLRKLAGAEKGAYPDPTKIYHAAVMVAYNEGEDVLVPSIEAVAKSGFPCERIVFVLGYEERGGEEMERTAKALKKRFNGVFREFLIVKHPAGVKGEVVGKGANLSYAGEELLRYVERKNLPVENVIVTSLDADNKVSRGYFDAVAYEFVVHTERQHLSYQPVALFTGHIWDVPAPMRVIAVSNSFFNVITTLRPQALRNFASHSQPLLALAQMEFWSRRTIVEDGHQYWRSLIFFRGDYDVLPVRLPIYQDAVIGDTLGETLKAQFVQLRRWDYGASDVAYVGSHLFSKRREVPFLVLLPKFVRLLEGHVTLAIMSPIVAFGGWVPMLMNLTSRSMMAFNLPNIVGTIQMIASIGLFVTILFSLKMLPPRPERYKKTRTVAMVLQWVLMPVIALVYTSAAAFYAQTRLMIGKYMEKFDVTQKKGERV